MSLSSKGGVRKTSTLNKEQKRILAILGPMIAEGLGIGAGDLGMPLFSEGETQAYEGAKSAFEGITGGFGEIQSLATGAFKDLLSGAPSTTISPEITNRFFEDKIQAPLLRSLSEDIFPALNRSTVGFGSRLNRRKAMTMEKAFEVLAAERANLQYLQEQTRIGLAESAQTRKAGALAFAPTLAAMGNIPLAASATFGSIAEGQQNRRLSEARRKLPESNPYMNFAAGLLGTPMTQFVTEPEKLTGFGNALASISAYNSTLGTFGFGEQGFAPSSSSTPAASSGAAPGAASSAFKFNFPTSF